MQHYIEALNDAEPLIFDRPETSSDQYLCVAEARAIDTADEALLPSPAHVYVDHWAEQPPNCETGTEAQPTAAATATMNYGRGILERRVDRYDGQTVWCCGAPLYELGNYLGGGAAGVVYEAYHGATRDHVALKILNPIGFKLLPSGPLQRYVVGVRGRPMDPDDAGPAYNKYPHHHPGSSVASSAQQQSHMPGNRCPPKPRDKPALTAENVWWLINPANKKVVAAYEDVRYGGLRELPLPRCVEIWGWNPPEAQDGADDRHAPQKHVTVGGEQVAIPRVPRKFVNFVRARRSVYREISNMASLGQVGHPNVLGLNEVLELVNDSKTTIFLVLEIASGGELFDRIKIDTGTEEGTARSYMSQLLSGVAFCHRRGICHRDLKPENLLLADEDDGAVLKIADFGLSALFSSDAGATLHEASKSPLLCPVSTAPVPIRRLTSVVGSPHYVAPEVLQDADAGYDGTKADVWSCGVILYAMLAGNLPFGKELLHCPRFEKFSFWARRRRRAAARVYEKLGPNGANVSIDEIESRVLQEFEKIQYPEWFFPSHFSDDAKSLLAAMLEPEPSLRMGVRAARCHAWLGDAELCSREDAAMQEEDPEAMIPEMSLGEDDVDVGGSCNEDAIVGEPVQSPLITAAADAADADVVAQSPALTAMSVLSLSPGSPLPTPTPAPLTPVNALGGSIGTSAAASEPRNGVRVLTLSPRQPARTSDVSLRSLNLPTLDGSRSALDPAPPSSGMSLLGGAQGAATAPSTSAPGSDSNPYAVPAPGSAAVSASSTAGRPRSNSPSRMRPLFSSPPLAPTSPHRLEEADNFALDSGDGDRTVNSSRMLFGPGSPADSAVVGQLDLKELKESQADPDSTMPLYRGLVKRSTRFTTSVPASEVLRTLQEMLQSGVGAAAQACYNVAVNTETYRLVASKGSTRTFTVQIFLEQAGLYMVEFIREQMDIFDFKRLYEQIRTKLSDIVKKDHTLQLLASSAVFRQSSQDQQRERSLSW